MSCTTPPGQLSADDLLYGFDVQDEETRAFLSSLIASGQAPQAELDQLRELSLMRGVEEWNMLFQCASALRAKNECLAQDDNSLVSETSLVPFLDAVLKGRNVSSIETATAKDTNRQAGKAKKGRKVREPRKRLPRKGVSHFWEEDGNSSEAAGRKGQGLGAQSPGPRCPENNQVAPVVASARGDKAEGGMGCLIAQEDQDSASVSQAIMAEIPWLFDELLSAVVTSESVPNGPACRLLEAPPDIERATSPTGGSKSPFFATSTPRRTTQSTAGPTPPSTRKKTRPPRGTVSSLPIPPLSADRFGLIQEELADDPFRLLIAITFLIRTTGKAAIPVFRQLMERFPTPEALAAADPAEIIPLIHPLGLSAVRCAAIQKYARLWLEKPPTREVRYGVKNYPLPGDGRHVKVGEEFGPEDGESPSEEDAVADARARAIGCAWEIGHLTQGPYALDSWRIFCRDVLLGRSSHWTGKGNAPEFQPEWMRVLPRDKELRACLRWMWMREGWEWDPLTGEREPLREELRRAVDEGRVGYDDSGKLVILDQEGKDSVPLLTVKSREVTET